MLNHRTVKFVLLIGLLGGMFLSSFLLAQPVLTLPRASQHAVVTQRIGITDITIDYHRPGVKDREIWGKLVPYGMSPGAGFNFGNSFPWRAGANENTTITFTHPVSVEGTPIPAGTYGLHMIPSESDWTIIFSKHNTAWGSFFYDESADAARVTVTPQPDEHCEWLMYAFEDLSDNSATAYLRWEKLKVPFKVEVDVNEIVLENMRRELRGIAAFNWRAWMQAANYCLQNNVNHEEALAWIDRSIGINKGVNNLAVKARLLMQMDKATEADPVMAEALAVAKSSGAENDVNNVGYLYLQSNKVDQAIDIFQLNVQKHPDSWNVYDSLGEAYHKKGDKEKALRNYKIALSKAPGNQKARIEGILATLQ